MGVLTTNTLSNLKRRSPPIFLHLSRLLYSRRLFAIVDPGRPAQPGRNFFSVSVTLGLILPALPRSSAAFAVFEEADRV